MSDLIIAGIDDSQINRTIFEETARLLSAEVIIGEDGQDGFQKILASVENDKIPNVIITDIHMPIMNGIELIEKLKAHSKTKYIPILVLTTEQDYEIKIQGKNLGAAGWITKPLSPKEIADVVKKFLRV